MKYLILILTFLSVLNCAQKNVEPIIADNTSYTENDNILSISASLKKQKDQSIILINRKQSTWSDFEKLIKKNEIKNIKIIKDKDEIEKSNFSYDKIKTIIIITK